MRVYVIVWVRHRLVGSIDRVLAGVRVDQEDSDSLLLSLHLMRGKVVSNRDRTEVAVSFQGLVEALCASTVAELVIGGLSVIGTPLIASRVMVLGTSVVFVRKSGRQRVRGQWSSLEVVAHLRLLAQFSSPSSRGKVEGVARAGELLRVQVL